MYCWKFQTTSTYRLLRTSKHGSLFCNLHSELIESHQSFKKNNYKEISSKWSNRMLRHVLRDIGRHLMILVIISFHGIIIHRLLSA